MQRRDFLKTSAAGAFLALISPSLSGCQSPTPDATPSLTPSPPWTPSPSEPGPYSVWREVQTALRTSPDHTIARAQRLVEDKDLGALHAFVRDEIRLVPGEINRLCFGSRVNWGTRAALRSAAGTAREKAELLAELVRGTGRTAEVVEVPPPPTQAVNACFFRRFPHPFAPQIRAEQFQDWKSRLGLPGDEPPGTVPIDLEQKEGQKIVRELVEAMNANPRYPKKTGNSNFRNYPSGRVPVVKITESDGSVLYADPITPQGRLGPADASHKEYSAEKLPELPTVKVTLLATLSDPSLPPKELVTGSFSVSELAGRQLRLGFSPAVDLPQLSTARFSDIRTFVPGLHLQSLDTRSEKPQVVVGDPFTLGGDTLQVAEDGAVTIDGQPLIAAGELKDSSVVKELTVHADASRFPEVKLLVKATDAEGKSVEGLAASAFQLSDQGQPFGFELASTQSIPHILFLADQSTSMPKEFRGGDSAMDQLVARITEMATKIHPAAKVTYRATDSNLWEQLAQASATSSTLVVYATDGDLVGRKPDAAMLEVMKNGPPALLLEVKGRLEALRKSQPDNLFDQMAKATNGWAYTVEKSDQEQAHQTVERVLRELPPSPPYVLRYMAASMEEKSHQVELKTSNAVGKASYQEPASPALPNQITSLRLRVETPLQTIERVLAGYDGLGDLKQQHLDAVAGALFGSHLLAFEAAPPSPSILLDDLLQAKLGWEALDRANANLEDQEAFEKAFSEGVPLFPGQLATFLMRSFEDSGSDYTFAAEGLRTVLLSSSPIFGTDQLVTRVDILPLERASAVAEKAEWTQELNLARSMTLAMAESTMFDTSTRKLLAGKKLVELGHDPFRGSELPLEKVEAWKRLISKVRADYKGGDVLTYGPEDGSELALWAVNIKTGEVLGVLPDGSGGAEKIAQMQKHLERLDQVVALLSLYLVAASTAGLVGPLGGLSLGIVAAYGQRLARMYATVAVAVLMMDNSGIDPALRRGLAVMACEVLKNIALGFFGITKGAEQVVNDFATFEGVVGVAKGKSPFSCS